MLRLKEQIYHAQKKIREQIEWNKVLECRPKPDPSDDQELNTFLSLYTETQNMDNFQDVPTLFHKIQQCENVRR